MHYQFLLVLFLLPVLHTAQAQCNSKEYTRIFNEASALQEKGEFIDAKNRYEAAKIYACDQKDTKAADDAVDALFEQINRIREQADSTALNSFANDLAYKSQIALERGDCNTAFKLAEIGLRYVDGNNYNLINAFVNALYYNDDPSHSPIPWAFNIQGHIGAVTSIAFSPDGKKLATGSLENTAKIWDVATGQLIMSLAGHSGNVNSVAFSPNGQNLATGSFDFTVKTWDIESGKNLLTFEGLGIVNSVAFSPDGRKLAAGFGNFARVWDLETDTILRTLGDHSDEVRTVAFSPNGEKLATGAGRRIWVWDIESGEILKNSKGHTYIINSICFSPDGENIAVSYNDNNTAKIFDWKKETVLLTLSGHSSNINSVSFSPDGKKLATGSGTFSKQRDNTVRIWDLASGKVLFILSGYSAKVSSVAFSPDGKILGTGSWDGTVKIWDLEPGKNLLSIAEHASKVTFSSDGRKLETWSMNNSPKVWDLNSGKELPSGDKSSQIEIFSSDGNWLKTKHISNRIWELKNDTVFLAPAMYSDDVLDFNLSPDGKIFVTRYENLNVKIWNIESGKNLITFNAQTDTVQGIIFSPNGKKLAVLLSDTAKIVKIWDLETGSSLMTLTKDPLDSLNLFSLEFSPNGEKLVIKYALSLWKGVSKVKILDLESGKPQTILNGDVACIFSPDEKKLATWDGSIVKIWDLQKGKELVTLNGLIYFDVIFSPEGEKIAGGSNDATAKIWDVESGQELLTLSGHTANIRTLAFSPDGKKLATVSDDETVKIWNFTPEGWYNTPVGNRQVAGLITSQLDEYNLTGILDLHSENEALLLQTRDTWQIAAFAELYAQKSTGISTPRKEDYERALRFFRACADTHVDDAYFEKRIADLEAAWKIRSE